LGDGTNGDNKLERQTREGAKHGKVTGVDGGRGVDPSAPKVLWVRGVSQKERNWAWCEQFLLFSIAAEKGETLYYLKWDRRRETSESGGSDRNKPKGCWRVEGPRGKKNT